MKIRHAPSLRLVILLALCGASFAAEPASIESLLRGLAAEGIDVIFSSELVPPEMLEPLPTAAGTPLQRARAALAAHGLALRSVAPGKYVVVRAAPAPQAPPDEPAPMEEISVYASRYSIDVRGITEPLRLSSGDIDLVPGSHDDALRALKSLPGLASNASVRPYIRGSLADDVLVRYDGITLLDPFHLKNFQSLISAIDPAGVERIEVFSGGFPVRYGTRSGGVIDVTAPSRAAGYENRVNASLISAGAASMGRAERMPLEWLFAIRRSTVDLLEPVEDEIGKPQFSDSLGRLRWHTQNGAWTLGWLLLDDRIELGESGDDEETADATYRDEYLWLARDHEFDPTLRTRLTAVLTSSARHRTGTLDQPGVAAGSLDASLDFDRMEASNLWSYEPDSGTAYAFGAEASVSRAQYDYLRLAQYDPLIAAGFGRPATNDLQYSIDPEVFTYGVHGSLRRQWSALEAEFGLRLDGQHFDPGGDHTQLSPRLNLRYDLNERMRLYASAGRFTQAQHVEEWRVEEAQSLPDASQVSTHAILGLSGETAAQTLWSVEAYTKRWSTVSPYFDNLLDSLSLNQELAPDRVRVDPEQSEASGLEVNVRRQLSGRASAWGTLSWARVADESGSSDVRRSWDQPLAATVGAAWQNSRLNLSALASWHRGWPRTPFVLTEPGNGVPGGLLLGARNAERWADYFTFDLRGAYHWPLPRGEFTLVLEVTNATNRENECCATLASADSGDRFESRTGHWLPVIVNLGFSYRWHQRE